MNIFKLNFFIKFKKSAIVKKENIAENITAIIAKKFSSALPCLYILNAPKKLAASNVGIAKKNEIFAESYLLKPNILPEVIVIPDLLTPGINAMA